VGSSLLQSINKIHKVQNITRIYALSKRNVILRYKNSLVGFFWGFFKPLLYLLIFIIIFQANSGVPNYVLFVTSGLVLWFFFSNVTGQSVGSIVSSSGLLKSLDIPAFFFPLSETIGELFNLLLTLVVFFVIMQWFGLVYSLKLLLIFPCILLFTIFALGLNLFLCSINVFFRDIGIIWGTIQPALFFLTPIGYAEKSIDPKYAIFIKSNPIYCFIKLGRSIFYDPVAPPWSMWSTCIIISLCTYVVGQFVFNRLKNQFISAI
jgi:ABC-type polysaccharide/polyol phosphate export permease